MLLLVCLLSLSDSTKVLIGGSVAVSGGGELLLVLRFDEFHHDSSFNTAVILPTNEFSALDRMESSNMDPRDPDRLLFMVVDSVSAAAADGVTTLLFSADCWAVELSSSGTVIMEEKMCDRSIAVRLRMDGPLRDDSSSSSVIIWLLLLLADRSMISSRDLLLLVYFEAIQSSFAMHKFIHWPETRDGLLSKFHDFLVINRTKTS